MIEKKPDAKATGYDFGARQQKLCYVTHVNGNIQSRFRPDSLCVMLTFTGNCDKCSFCNNVTEIAHYT